MSLLKVRDVARLLNCGTSTVYNLVSEDRIPYLRIGRGTLRFDSEEIAAWLQSCKRGTHAPIQPEREVVHGLHVDPPANGPLEEIPAVSWSGDSEQEGRRAS